MDQSVFVWKFDVDQNFEKLHNTIKFWYMAQVQAPIWINLTQL